MMKENTVAVFDCKNHEKVHDNVQIPEEKIKERRETKAYSPTEDHSNKTKPRNEKNDILSAEQIEMFVKEIRPVVKSKILEQVLEEEWKSAVKGLKFLIETEKLILTQCEKSAE